LQGVFAQTEDTSILSELNKKNIATLNLDFKMKSFQSCQNFEDTMTNYIKEYWKNNQGRYAYPVLYKTGL
jgi:hypothetical protein